MPWTCGKNTCPSRYTFFGKGCKRTLFRGLERATWTGYSNSKNRPLTLFEKEYYDPPPAYRRRPEITRMEAQTASARGYLKLPGRHPFPAAGGQRKGTSLRMSLSFGTLRLPKIEPCRFFGGGGLFYPESLGFARG
mgnify:CR=1 FL=1